MQPLVSLEWATEYFITSRPKSDEWDAVDDAARQQYLGWASERIKSAFKFNADVDIYDNKTMLDNAQKQTVIQEQMREALQAMVQYTNPNNQMRPVGGSVWNS